MEPRLGCPLWRDGRRADVDRLVGCVILSMRLIAVLERRNECVRDDDCISNRYERQVGINTREAKIRLDDMCALQYHLLANEGAHGVRPL